MKTSMVMIFIVVFATMHIWDQFLVWKNWFRASLEWWLSYTSFMWSADIKVEIVISFFISW